jgi:SAM-dependent methyltransferase
VERGFLDRAAYPAGVGEIQSRERAFYDAQVAEGGEPGPPRPPDRFEAALLDALGPVDGRRVLELGCGTGDLSLELLRRGARLTALDVSPASVALLRERAERFMPGAPLRPLVAGAEETGLEAGSVDRVVGKWILHHADAPAALRELRRVLRPGGSGAFFENQALNPLLRFARKWLMGAPGVRRVGTADEAPLAAADLALVGQLFESAELGYPSMYFLEALGRALGHRAILPLRRVDAALWRVPPLRRYSYHVLIRLAKAGPSDEPDERNA